MKEFPVDKLRKLYRFDSETGLIFFNERTPDDFRGKANGVEKICYVFNRNYAGKEAFATKHIMGYKQGTILKKKYLAHRVAWALHYGFWPSGEIDHINGNKVDNRIDNLRDVNHRENGLNQKLKSNNKSGVNGVLWDKSIGKWSARIMVDGKLHILLNTSSFEEACNARREADLKYKFHENHGAKK